MNSESPRTKEKRPENAQDSNRHWFGNEVGRKRRRTWVGQVNLLAKVGRQCVEIERVGDAIKIEIAGLKLDVDRIEMLRERVEVERVDVLIVVGIGKKPQKTS